MSLIKLATVYIVSTGVYTGITYVNEQRQYNKLQNKHYFSLFEKHTSVLLHFTRGLLIGPFITPYIIAEKYIYENPVNIERKNNENEENIIPDNSISNNSSNKNITNFITNNLNQVSTNKEYKYAPVQATYVIR